MKIAKIIRALFCPCTKRLLPVGKITICRYPICMMLALVLAAPVEAGDIAGTSFGHGVIVGNPTACQHTAGNGCTSDKHDDYCFCVNTDCSNRTGLNTPYKCAHPGHTESPRARWSGSESPDHRSYAPTWRILQGDHEKRMLLR